MKLFDSLNSMQQIRSSLAPLAQEQLDQQGRMTGRANGLVVAITRDVGTSGGAGWAAPFVGGIAGSADVAGGSMMGPGPAIYGSPTVEFVDPGGSVHRFVSSVGTVDAPKVGDAVTVQYDPSDPSQAQVAYMGAEAAPMLNRLAMGKSPITGSLSDFAPAFRRMRAIQLVAVLVVFAAYVMIRLYVPHL